MFPDHSEGKATGHLVVLLSTNSDRRSRLLGKTQRLVLSLTVQLCFFTNPEKNQKSPDHWGWPREGATPKGQGWWQNGPSGETAEDRAV